jgi:hypothetical protein
MLAILHWRGYAKRIRKIDLLRFSTALNYKYLVPRGFANGLIAKVL